jgi:L-seryl-tRNA(Ser) seleniumtransferase
VELASSGIALPERYAKALRGGRPPVLARVERGTCVLDLFAVEAGCDQELFDAVAAVS